MKSSFFSPLTHHKIFFFSAVLVIYAPLSTQVLANTSELAMWSGKTTLSLNAFSGNTNTRALKAALKIVRNKNPDSKKPIRHTFTASTNTSDRAKERGGKRTKLRDKKEAGYKTSYFLGDRSSIRVFVFYESDAQAKLDAMIMSGLGYEHKLLKMKNHKIIASIGASYIEIQYDDETPGITGPAGRAAFNYNGILTSNINLNQSFILTATDGLTVKKSVTSFEYVLSERSSIAWENKITHFSFIPPAAIAKKDISNSINLILKF